MKKKIVVVEDELPIRTALVTKLGIEGYEVYEAGNGEEGLKVIQAHEPDLVLLDIRMPYMDGLTMLQKLRTEDWGKDTKVIMLTNDADVGSVAATLESGAFDYIVKSDWKLEDVVTKVRDTVGE